MRNRVLGKSVGFPQLADSSCRLCPQPRIPVYGDAHMTTPIRRLQKAATVTFRSTSLSLLLLDRIPMSYSLSMSSVSCFRRTSFSGGMRESRCASWRRDCEHSKQPLESNSTRTRKTGRETYTAKPVVCMVLLWLLYEVSPCYLARSVVVVGLVGDKVCFPQQSLLVILQFSDHLCCWLTCT